MSRVQSGGFSASFIDDGSVNSASFASGAITSTAIGSGAVQSGNIASGSVGQFKLSSGAVNSGHIGNAAVVSGSIASGQIAAQHLSSGLLAGATTSGFLLTQFRTAQTISGGRCVTVVASGVVAISIPAQNGSGMPCIGVVYDNVLSGQLANVFVAGQGPAVAAIEGGMGAIGTNPVYVGTSGLLAATVPLSGSVVTQIGVFTGLSGQAVINVVPVASGSIGAFRLGVNAVRSGNVGSGQLAGFGKSGLAEARMIASGTIGGFDLADNSVNSGQLGAAQIGHQHFFGGVIGVNPGFDAALAYGVGFGNGAIITGQGQMSGGAVAFSTNLSGKLTVVPAERQSGLRLPCIGVMASGAASGDFALIVTQGFVQQNHFIASGFTGQPLYVGSGGFIVTQSGIGGLFSGPLQISGSVIQRVGVCISGGMLVQIDPAVTSGLNTTPMGTF